MRTRTVISILAAVAFVSAGCSTTRTLPEGTFRLADNKVRIENPDGLTNADITPYIKQSPNRYFIFGWNPFLNVYNWSDGSGKGINKLWEKIGTAPVQFSQASMESSRDNIRDHLNYLGYYDSKIETRIDTTRRLVKVNYTVRPGKRYRIDSLYFTLPSGNRDFKQEFNNDLKNVLVKKGDFLSEKVLEDESARSAGMFNNLGYYDFNKNNYFFEVDTLGGTAALNYEIRDYNRNETILDSRPINKYRFGKISIERSANIKFDDNVIKRLNTIHTGALYNEGTVNATFNRLSSLKLFNGVGIELLPTDDNTIDCNIRLSESTIHGVKGNLEFSTNSTGLMGVSPKISWYHKNIFRGAEWLTIDFSSNFQFKPKTDVKATELSLSGTLSFPRFIGLPETVFSGEVPRTEIKTSFSYQNRPEYRRTIASVSYGYNGQFNKNFFYQLQPFRTNVVKMYQLSESFLKILEKNPALVEMFMDHIDMGVSGMLYYTTNSDIVPKTSYWYSKLYLDASGNVLKLFNVNKLFGLDYSNYVRGELSLGQTVRFGKDDGQALAARFVAGAGLDVGPSGSSMPFEKMFFVGGASSMRGWQSRTLGPGYLQIDPEIYKEMIPSQVGDMKLELDLEYRFRMFWKLEGALFAETGNIWTIRKGEYLTESTDFSFHDFYNSLAADWGAGLRVNLDFILVRVDLGIKLRDPSRAEGQRWISPKDWFGYNGFTVHFGVGYPF